jgi:O-antigen ligase
MEWKKSKSSGAYNALLLFTFIYYTRPEDLIPVLNHIPLEKILGGIALIALISSLASGALKRKLPLELKLLMLLFAHLVISIPFAFWRGGAFVTVFERFSKTVIISFLVTMLIDQFDQLRRLLWVQAASMVVTTISSILIHHTDKGRLIGALGGIFENPNDLAINISINWPLCLGFLLAARGMGKKVVWGVGVVAMLLGVILTYSRSGLLAMMMAVGICLWEFGIKGKRIQLIIAAVILGFVGLGAMFAIPHYITRVESLFKGNIQGSEDHGSLEARKEVLILAVMETVHHPIFGIGAGNFGAASGTWRVTHNTYMEFAAEGGLPAVFLFVAILFLAMRNINRTRSLSAYRDSSELRLFTGALWASLAAFMVGALFASFEYHLFPYYMVAYSSVLYRLARERSEQGTGEIVQEPVKGNIFWKRYSGEYVYAEDRTTAIDRTRR